MTLTGIPTDYEIDYPPASATELFLKEDIGAIKVITIIIIL